MIGKRKTWGGSRGRHEHSYADSDWNTHCDGARPCNDEVGAKDFERRLNILREAVQQMEQAGLSPAA